MTISVRNVDEALYKEFYLEAKRRDKAVGEAMAEAMKLWLKSQHRERKLSDITPWSFGPGTEEISKNIDEIAYGNTD